MDRAGLTHTHTHAELILTRDTHTSVISGELNMQYSANGIIIAEGPTHQPLPLLSIHHQAPP